MKCDEFTSLVEEYLDGNLKSQSAERVRLHMSSCKSCASAFDELERENEIYASYSREVDVTPDMWQAVHARINEADASTSDGILARSRGWVIDLFGPKLRAAYGVALAVLVLIAGSFAMFNYLNQESVNDLSAVYSAPANLNFGTEALLNSRATAPAIVEQTRGSSPTVKEGSSTTSASSKVPGTRTPRRDSSDGATRPINTPTPEDDVLAYIPPAASESGLDISRHVEKAQMLLRSFRNVRLAETSHAPDVSYEREQSRKLLYQNIALRREAASQGNESAESVLSALEPILLDIANLPNRTTPRDIRSIEQRMRKKEIVATLQLHSLQASNSY
jgi:hypothetical protein